jgi:hypothetical protein
MGEQNLIRRVTLLTEFTIWTIIYTRQEAWDVRIPSPVCLLPMLRRESIAVPLGINGAETYFREEN